MREHLVTPYGTAVNCPHCGDIYMHHDVIDVFTRTDEDSASGSHVVVDGHTTTLTTDLSSNPSLRRDGIKIHMWCECCLGRSVMTIVQHKGITFVDVIKGPDVGEVSE